MYTSRPPALSTAAGEGNQIISCLAAGQDKAHACSIRPETWTSFCKFQDSTSSSNPTAESKFFAARRHVPACSFFNRGARCLLLWQAHSLHGLRTNRTNSGSSQGVLTLQSQGSAPPFNSNLRSRTRRLFLHLLLDEKPLLFSFLMQPQLGLAGLLQIGQLGAPCLPFSGLP